MEPTVVEPTVPALDARTMSLAAVAPGEPFDRGVWSSISYHLLDALSPHVGQLAAVNGKPELADRLEKLACASASRARWRQRFSSRSSPISPFARRAWSSTAVAALTRLSGPVDAVLQFGGWYDLSAYRPGTGVARGSYHDGNLATYLQHPDLVLDPRSRSVRRAWEFERRLYDGLDVIFTMSEWTRGTFVDEFGQPADKVVAVGAGPNFEALPEPQTEPPATPRLLFVGKGDFARKGGPQVVEAFARVRAEVPDAELWIIGQERPPSTAPGVVSLGFVPRSTPDGATRVQEAFRGATAYVMPSVYEPFGIAFLEAMAYGLPVVAGTGCAMPEIVRDGETGYVVSPRDVDALAERLLALVRDPALARRLGDAGRQRVLDWYSWDGVAARIADRLAAVGARR